MKKDDNRQGHFEKKRTASPQRKGKPEVPSDESTEKKEKKIYKGRNKNQQPVYEWKEDAPQQNRINRRQPFSAIRKKGPSEEEAVKPSYSRNILDPKNDNSAEQEIRLNKYIANSGICSRREADALIEKGLVRVNGEIITSLGYKVKRGDQVVYKGKVLNPEKPVYLLLNKPKDYITTTDDPFERRTVMHLIANACEERIFPVGRLDRNTTGLLLFTNDGELTEKLAHPSNEVKKIYQVSLDKALTKNDAEVILEGIELEDGLVKVDDLQVLSKDRTILGLEIHSGKNRIVRRLFAHFGYDVIALDRVMYAGLTKKDLPRGRFRFLTEKEVITLKYLRKSKK